MAYDLTNFSDYIGRENEVLTKMLFAGGDTAKFARYMTGIKGSTEIPQLSGSSLLQAGNCAAPSGTTAGDLITIAVKPFTVYESYCADDLQTKFPNMVIAPGSNETSAPKAWEEALVDTKMASIAEQLEVMYWQGDTVASDLFDGFIKLIDGATGVIDGNPTDVASITKANVIALVDGVRSAAPAKIKRNKDFSIMVGDDIFDLYIAAEKDANMYHYKPEHEDGVYRIGGSGIKLVRVYGLEGTNRMFASVGSNFIVGSDVENESAVADMWYDKTSDLTHLRVKAKAGVQIVNPDEIVEFHVGV